MIHHDDLNVSITVTRRLGRAQIENGGPTYPSRTWPKRVSETIRFGNFNGLRRSRQPPEPEWFCAASGDLSGSPSGTQPRLRIHPTPQSPEGP